MPLVVTDTPPE